MFFVLIVHRMNKNCFDWSILDHLLLDYEEVF
jgi:hypothetical protein